MTAAASVRVSDLVVDCNDLVRQPAFWMGLLDLPEVSRSQDWVALGRLGAGGPNLCFQVVPETKKAKNRLHLDIVVADAVATGRRAAAQGATAASALHEGRAGPWQVWRDPEGNEFCLISAPGPDAAPHLGP